MPFTNAAPATSSARACPIAVASPSASQLSIAATDVDRVFLTGGTSFVPAVRRIFERRFGADIVETGNEFVSIANGLATIGLREDVDAWTVEA